MFVCTFSLFWCNVEGKYWFKFDFLFVCEINSWSPPQQNIYSVDLFLQIYSQTFIFSYKISSSEPFSIVIHSISGSCLFQLLPSLSWLWCLSTPPPCHQLYLVTWPGLCNLLMLLSCLLYSIVPALQTSPSQSVHLRKLVTSAPSNGVCTASNWLLSSPAYLAVLIMSNY